MKLTPFQREYIRNVKNEEEPDYFRQLGEAYLGLGHDMDVDEEEAIGGVDQHIAGQLEPISQEPVIEKPVEQERILWILCGHDTVDLYL
jgi:hypothetical protein